MSRRRGLAWGLAVAGLLVLSAVSAAAASDKIGGTTKPATCPYQVRALVSTLTTLEGHVQAGLTIGQYRKYLATALTADNRVAWKQVSYSCTSHVGVPGERALNDYSRALTSWSNCLATIAQLAATNGVAYAPGFCTDTSYSRSSGPFMQREWKDASANLTRAVNALG